MNITLSVILLLFVTWVAIPAAQVEGPLARRAVRVTGEATVLARPDEAQIELGVRTQAANAEAAVERNARLLAQVQQAVRRTLGSSATMETIGYTLQPEYRQSPDRDEHEIIGYSATNMLRVTVPDITRVGAVIDAATSAGANQVARVGFGLKSRDAAEASALRQAAVNARAEAETLAWALGVTLGRVASIVEQQPSVMPYAEMSVARAGATPIAPGAIEVRAVVTLAVEISNTQRAMK